MKTTGGLIQSSHACESRTSPAVSSSKHFLILVDIHKMSSFFHCHPHRFPSSYIFITSQNNNSSSSCSVLWSLKRLHSEGRIFNSKQRSPVVLFVSDQAGCYDNNPWAPKPVNIISIPDMKASTPLCWVMYQK